MYVAKGATLHWIDDKQQGVSTGGGGGVGGGPGDGAKGGGGSPVPSEKQKQGWLTDVKDWANGVFSGKQPKKLTDQDVLTNKLGAEFLRTWPNLLSNNWQLQQFLYMNKQKYYNSPLLNAIAAYRTWEEGKKSGSVAGMGVVTGETQYAVVALMAWLDQLYTLNYVYSLNLDDLSKMTLPGNDLKKDERAPEPDKQNNGGPYNNSNKKLLWIGLALVGVIVVSVIIYFATKKTGSA